jgi:O-antigen/teichoic acid export membrane protein
MKLFKIDSDIRQILFKNSFLILSAEFLNKILMFSLSIIIARYLGAEGYGQFAFAMSFASLFFIFADFGISTLAVKEIARNNDIAKKYLNNFAILKLLLSIVTILLLCLVLSFIGKPFSIELMVYLFGGYILISSTSEFISSIFRAYEKMEYIALSIIIRAVLLTTFGSIFIFLDLGIYYVIFSYLLSSLFCLFFLIYSLQKNILKFSLEFDFNFNFELLKRASPLALSLAFASIYLSIDTILISYFIGDIEVGIYSIGYGLTIVLYAIPAILTNVYFPKMSIYFKSDKLKLRSTLRLLLLKLSILVVPIVIFLYFFASHIILLFYGPEFSSSIIIFQILLLALFLKFFSFPYAFLLVAADQQNIRLFIQAFTAIFNLIANIIFIPSHGIAAAAITTVLSELLLVTMYYFFARKALN